MLKNLLNLLPAPLVRKLGDSSFESLENRGEIQTWMVATKKTSDGNDDSGSDKQVSQTWDEILNDDHDYENCDYDEDELSHRDDFDFDGFTS